MPLSLATPITAGEGVVAGVGADVGLPAAAACVATVVCGGAVLLGGAAIAIAWHWKGTHNANYADPPPSTPGGIVSQTSTLFVTTAPTYTSNRFFNANMNFLPNVNGPKIAAFQNSDGARCYTNSNVPAYHTSGSGPYAVAIDTNGCNGGASEIVWIDDSRSFPTSYAGALSAGGILLDFRPGYTPAASGSSGTQVVTTTPRSSCSNGTTTQLIDGASMTYTGSNESDTLPPVIVPACPAGYQRTGFTTPSTGAGGATVPQPLGWTAPIIPSQYASCQPGGSAAPCVMTLVKTSPAGQKTNCTGSGACAGWNPAGEADGSTYECKWGPYTLAPSECKTVPTEGAPPASSTATDTATGVKTAGTGTGTGSDPADENCKGHWSWNPIDWVEDPVKCAGRYVWDHVIAPAIVPSTQTRQRFSDLGTNLKAKAPFGYVGQVTGFVGGMAPSGCETGPTINAGIGGTPYSFKPANLCSGELHDALHPLRTVLGIVLWGGLLIAFGMWLFRASVPVVGAGEGA